MYLNACKDAAADARAKWAGGCLIHVPFVCVVSEVGTWEQLLLLLFVIAPLREMRLQLLLASAAHLVNFNFISNSTIISHYYNRIIYY